MQVFVKVTFKIAKWVLFNEIIKLSNDCYVVNFFSLAKLMLKSDLSGSFGLFGTFFGRLESFQLARFYGEMDA